MQVGFDWMVVFACLDLMQLLIIYSSYLFCCDCIGGFVGMLVRIVVGVLLSKYL